MHASSHLLRVAFAPDSSLLANHAAPLATTELDKIGRAMAKGRRALLLHRGSASTEEEMKEEPNKQHSNGAEPVRIWKARNFIEAHAGEELSLGKVARATNTSPNYFSEKFKEATGMNFVTYVARTRFEKAAALLRKDNLRISEIAFACGFQSLSQFNRVFKKLAGKSPTEYRRALQKTKRGP
jgi:AraC-like DNA-binding protein